MLPAVVIDNGTGYTKMGYSGNNDPAFIIPTAIATAQTQTKSQTRRIDDLDYFIGDEALANSKSYNVSYPVRHGQVFGI